MVVIVASNINNYNKKGPTREPSCPSRQVLSRFNDTHKNPILPLFPFYLIIRFSGHSPTTFSG